jgi:hypothetical protein
MDLDGRRILFIGIGFYDYEQCIVDRLRALGATVLAFENPPRAVGRGLLAGLLKRLPTLSDRLTRWHERSMLRQAIAMQPDQVVVIKSTNLSVDFLRQMRTELSGAEFVLYQWDSMARLAGIAERLPCFDRVLTFDHRDAQQDPALTFRPLFFREWVEASGSSETSCDIDISFVGWLHSDRLKLVREIELAAGKDGLSVYVYLFTGIATWLRLALRGQARGVHVRPMPYERLISINRRSRCVLDLPHPEQSGLTMRAVESLGFGRRLVTTSKDIVKYDFFGPESVALIDAERPRVDPTFLEARTAPVADAIRRRYSLDAWIADVVGPTPRGQVSTATQTMKSAGAHT